MAAETQIVAPNLDIEDEKIAVDGDLLKHLADEYVSISLKYYHRKSQCWSAWQTRELKDFSGTIEKLRRVTATQLQQGGTPRFDSHKGPAKGAGFKRPDELSKDMQLYEIHLGGKSRIHGFLVGPVFFLVWLDRKHEVFPDGK